MKATVLIESDKDRIITHNDFMSEFAYGLFGWLSSSNRVDRIKSKPMLYIAVGGGDSTGDKTSLDKEFLRIPISAKFLEPVSARTRVLATFNASDANSIIWKEIGLYSVDAISVVLNRCDSLGKWVSGEGFRLFTSSVDCVQDNGSLFCEFSTSSAAVNLFSTVDLADGTGDKEDRATAASIPYKSLSYVNASSTRFATNPVKIGKESTVIESGAVANRAAIVFDLSDLPSDAVFLSAKLAGNIVYVNPTPSIKIAPYNGNAANDPVALGETAANQYTRSTGSTTYVSQSTEFSTLGYREIDLESSAVTDMNTVFASGKKFCIGLVEDGDTEGEICHLADPVLNLEYKRNTSLGVNAKQLGKDSDLLQFYLFLGSTDIFTNNNITVILSSSDTVSTDEWKWVVKSTSLENGWNCIQLALGEATITGSPNAANLKRFTVSVDGISSPGLAGLDNVRLFRPTTGLMNRVVLDNGYVKQPGVSTSVQWIIDFDSGI